ncbi:hypothetical protein AWM75_00390 [Aerococcus urinaehominis]|uniref:Tagatose-6-phosphate kinase n=1 Tax=Aerococcus urinaehominis TaxID=128944 RepID=A0A109RGC0_9LACT|nr:1-phosphofructokinase [Aerococcus urinaehominis]AMB98541.1 hypothetical protein AWM75_00390 [Aerococcus urinaehominis]SDL78806.1 1-phosphofructokinase [Aerococcus urinaehominis]
MIYTLTLNPAIDYIMYLNDLDLGETNRSKSERLLPGGKGINVSRVLNQLGQENTALGFLGGHTGQFISDWLRAEGSQTDFVNISGQSRINVKLKGEQETEINGQGPEISPEEVTALLAKVDVLNQDDLLIITGNAPASLGADFNTRLAKHCSDRQIPFVLDIASPDLFDILPYQPVLVKPNRAELEALYDTKISNQADTIALAQDILAKGAQNVIVSLGGDGALLVNQDGAFQANAPAERVVNTVGAGDSMVAGFVASLSQGQPAGQGLKLGSACSADTTQNEDLATKDGIARMLDKVIVEKI